MHEFSICQTIIEAVLDELKKNGPEDARLTRVRIVAGWGWILTIRPSRRSLPEDKLNVKRSKPAICRAPAADPRRKKREQQEEHDGKSQIAKNDLAFHLPGVDDGGRKVAVDDQDRHVSQCRRSQE